MNMDNNLYSIITEFVIEGLQSSNEVSIKINLLGSPNSKLYKEILNWAKRRDLQAVNDNKGLLLISQNKID